MEDHEAIKAAFLGKKCSLAKKSYGNTFRILFGEMFVERLLIKEEIKSFDYAEISLHAQLGNWVLMTREGEILAGSDGSGFDMKALSRLENHTLTGMHIREGYVSLIFEDAYHLLLRAYDDNTADEEVALVFEKNHAVCKILSSGAVIALATTER